MTDAEEDPKAPKAKAGVDLPPYMSYPSLVSFNKGLKDAGMPARVDRGILKKMSGGQQSALIGALRFLGLTDKSDIPTPLFNQLIDADDENYPTVLRSVLQKSYAFLSDSGLNLEQATGMQVAEAFRKTGISGSTVIKAMSFYIAAAKAAGIKLSGHIKPPSLPKSNGARKVAKPKVQPQVNAHEIKHEQTPPTPPEKTIQQQLLEKFPAFDPSWDAETQKKWFDNFTTFMNLTKG